MAYIPTTIWIDEELKSKAKDFKHLTGIHFKEMVNDALRAYFEEQKKIESSKK